jgi:hypothetical protein
MVQPLINRMENQLGSAKKSGPSMGKTGFDHSPDPSTGVHVSGMAFA